MQRRTTLVFLLSLAMVSIQLLGCGGGGTQSALAITGTLPATGSVGIAYTGVLGATGGTAPYSWTVMGLPAGLTPTGASTATLTIAGTPTSPGTSNVSATVTDSKGATATSGVTLVISPATLAIGPTTLGILANGTAVTPITLTAAPATTGPYTWTVSPGSLPAGLVLDNGTATSPTTIQSTTNSVNISGTPTAAGAYSFTLTVTDSVTPTADTASQAFAGTVNAVVAACAPLPTLRGNEAALTLPYAFLLKGADANNLPIAWAGSFTPNGNGGITAADVDFIGTTDGPESLQVQLAGSSYSYGSDGRGCLYLAFTADNVGARPASTKVGNANLRHGNARKQVKVHPAVVVPAGTVTFSFSLGSASETGRITQFDFATSQIVTAGQMHQQLSTDFALSKLAPNFAFGMDGWFTEDAEDIERTAIAGSFANVAGALSNGTADDNIGGGDGVSGELTGGSGTLSAVSATTGRGTGTYTIPTTDGALTFDFAYYIVNGSDFYLISTDDPATIGNFILSGRALKASATSVALNGYYMAAVSGIDLSSGDGVGNNVVTIGTLQATSAGAIPTATIYTNDAGMYQSQPFSNGTYALDTSTGRVTITGVGTAPVAYVTATADEDDIAAFVVGTDDFSSSGFLALQGTAAPNFGVSNLTGGYAFGSAEDVTGINGSEVGVFTFDGNGNYTAVLDNVAATGGAQANQTASGTIVVNTDGSGSFDGGAEAFVTNGTLVLGIDASNGATQPLLYVFVQQVTAQ